MRVITLAMPVMVLVGPIVACAEALEIVHRSNESPRGEYERLQLKKNAVYSRAHKHVGLGTQRASDLRIFVAENSALKKELYVHANYCPPKFHEDGSAFGETRLIVRSVTSIAALVDAVLVETTPRDVDDAGQVASRATVIVEQDLLENPAFGDLDFAGVGGTRAVCDDGRVRPFRTVVSGDDRALRVVELSPFVYDPLGGDDRRLSLRRLMKIPFDHSRVRTMSWVIDETVCRTLEELMRGQNIVVDWKSTPTRDAIKKHLHQSSGTLIIAIGSVLDGRLVVRDAHGSTQFAMPLDELVQAASEQQVQLLLVEWGQINPPTPQRDTNEAKATADETAAPMVFELVHCAKQRSIGRLVDFMSRFVQETSGARYGEEAPTVGLLGSVATADLTDEQTLSGAFNLTIRPVSWQDGNGYLGPPTGRVLFFVSQQGRRPHILSVRNPGVWIVTLLVATAVVLTAYVAWGTRRAKKISRRASGRDQPL